LRLVAGVDGFLREALHAEVIDQRFVAIVELNAM
jgi:hypothetical protein